MSKQKDNTTNAVQEICESGNLQLLSKRFPSSYDEAANFVNENDLLYFSIKSKNLDIVKFCSDKQADLQRRYGKLGESVLHTACAVGNLEIIGYLINIAQI